jgi:hypothetical protein
LPAARLLQTGRRRRQKEAAGAKSDKVETAGPCATSVEGLVHVDMRDAELERRAPPDQALA